MKAKEYIQIALAIETLAYHDKNYLSYEMIRSNARISEEIQKLLMQALSALEQKSIGKGNDYDNR